METSLREEEAFAALQTAAAGRNLLLLVDDAWRLEQVRLLNCIDPRTASRALVTTRISGLVPGAPAEFSLGVLKPEDAIASGLPSRVFLCSCSVAAMCASVEQLR